MDLRKVELSNGEAYLQPYIDTETSVEYSNIIVKNVVQPAYTPTEDELAEIEKLPIQEKLKAKALISAQIPAGNATEAMNFLTFRLVKKLVIDGKTLPAVKENIVTLNAKDFDKIQQEAMKISEENSAKKKPTEK